MSQAQTQVLASLKHLPLTQFDGDPWKWEAWLDDYWNRVHTQDLSPLFKFKLLRQSLVGVPKASIAELTECEANYEVALSLLHQQYGNQKQNKRTITQRLQNLPAAGRSAISCRVTYNSIVARLADLERLESVDSELMRGLIYSKFPESLGKQLLRKQKGYKEEDWTVHAVLTILNDLIRDLETDAQLETPLQDRPSMTMAAAATPHRPRRSTEPPTATRAVPALKDSSRKRRPLFRCVYCSEAHFPTTCSNVVEVAARRQILKEQKRCLNCLGTDHRVANCKRGNCRRCNGRHHTSICPGSERGAEEKRLAVHAVQQVVRGDDVSEAPLEEDSCLANSSLSMAACLQHAFSRMINAVLITLELKVFNPKKEIAEKASIFIDAGGQGTFIDEEFWKKLGLIVDYETRLSVDTFANQGKRTTFKSKASQLQISNGRGKFDLSVMSTPYIIPAPKEPELTEADKQFLMERGVVLAPRSESATRRPDIMIGADQCWQFIDFTKPKLSLPSGLDAIPSVFGYLITGSKIDCLRKSQQGPFLDGPASAMHNYCTQIRNVADTWTLEGIGISENADNKLTYQGYLKDLRKEGGLPLMHFPWRRSPSTLPDNYSLAISRLNSVFRKYGKDKEIMELYDGVFKDQLEKGVLEEVDDTREESPFPVSYLPHQPVITPQKETTKLRPVLDASAHLRGQPSLNDLLDPGPSLLPQLPAISLRLRFYLFVVIADVEKAFLQLRLRKQDRDVTRMLWLTDIGQPPIPSNVKVFRYARVPFGVNSSPFLLAAAIRSHLEDKKEDWLCEVINNTYVDNIILGSETTEEAERRCFQLKDIFGELSMNLREFRSMNRGLNEALTPLGISEKGNQKVLGVTWNTDEDVLLTPRIPIPEGLQPTRRNVMSDYGQTFDPMGWMSPLLFKTKLFIQDLWRKKYSWNEELSEEDSTRWAVILREKSIEPLALPRRIATSSENLQLCIFSDASELGYSAAAYVLDRQGGASKLLFAKARLTPIKRITIPRLELLGALIASRISKYIFQELRGVALFTKVHFFLDSQIALAWIHSSKNLPVFIANRVSEIRSTMELLDASVTWHYVETSENPADAATRGVTAEAFASHYWWTGPGWLLKEEDEWPNKDFDVTQAVESLVEENLIVTAVSSQTVENEESADDVIPWSRFNSIFKLQKIVVWSMRFIQGLVRRLIARAQRSKGRQKSRLMKLADKAQAVFRFFPSGQGGPPSVPEVKAARFFLIWRHQKILSVVTTDYKDLNVVSDDSDILRTRGRLGKVPATHKTRFPAVIRPRTRLAELLILEAHEKNRHSGVAQTLADTRAKVWILTGRADVRRTLCRCITCRRFTAPHCGYPPSPNLPEMRVRRGRPFLSTGIDFFGPLQVRGEHEEMRTVSVLLFTCLTTRLVHLEVCPNQDTEGVMTALRRFSARRGVPDIILSDNASVFRLGKDVLDSTTAEATVLDFLTKKGIQWKYIVPLAPWQGGVYERMVGLVKNVIKKTVGKRLLTVEAFTTFIVEAEATVNCRPLTYVDADSLEDQILRPIDYIVPGIRLQHAGFEDQEDTYKATIPSTREQVIEAWKSTQEHRERFWTLWNEHYLRELREHHLKNVKTGRHSPRVPEEGEVVLESIKTKPRSGWPLARVVQINHDADGQVRSAVIKKGNGEVVTRDLTKLVSLELQAPLTEKFMRTFRKGQDKEGETFLPRRSDRLKGKERVDYREEASNEESL